VEGASLARPKAGGQKDFYNNFWIPKSTRNRLARDGGLRAKNWKKKKKGK
jgi:hypothetical protein